MLNYLTMYLSKAGFSALAVKSKYRSRLDPQHNMRCAFSINIHANIEELVESIQHQGSYKEYYSVLNFSSKLIFTIL